MKRKSFTLIFGAVLLLSLTCCKSQKKQTEPPTLLSISLQADAVNQYLLESEKLDFSNASITFLYSDMSTIDESITDGMISDLEYTFGSHTAEITYCFKEENHFFSLDYYVFGDLSELNVVKKIHQLPYINNLSVDHVDQVSSAVNSYKELLEDEKEFLDTYFKVMVDRLNKTEKTLINIYKQSKIDELKEFYRTLNRSSYDATNLQAIINAINSFSNQTFNSLEDIISGYQNVVSCIESIEKLVVPLDEYKTLTIDYLRQRFNINFSAVTFNTSGIGNPAIFETSAKDYLALESLSSIYNEAVSSINGASNTDGVDNAFKNAFLKIEQTVAPIFIEDAVANIRNIFNNLHDIEKELLDSWNDITISVTGLYDNILVDYLDDNRWWMPEAYRPKILLNAIEPELKKHSKIDDLVELYNDLVYEVTRSTLQKNLEMYYSIWRNRNPVYDTANYYYWNVVADFWGDTPARQFVYNGPLSEYKGTIYGSSSNSAYRLAGYFYNDSIRVKTSEALLDKYFYFKNYIAPPPLAVSSSEVDVNTVKTEYELDEPIDLMGGQAVVTYNDTSTARVNLDTSMIYGAVDTSTTGSKEVTVKFNEPKLNTEQTAKFSIVVLSNDEKYNQIIVKISNLPVIEKATQQDIARAEEVLTLFNALTTSKQEYFIETFSSEYTKMRNYESACSSLYGELSLNPVFRTYEKTNVLAFSGADQTTLSGAFNTMITNVKAHHMFSQIDTDIKTFTDLLEATEFDSALDLAGFKEATVSSINALCEFELNHYSGVKNHVVSNYTKQSVKDSESVKPLYDGLVANINSATSKDDVAALFNNNVDALYENILAAYKTAANVNLHESMYDLRSTISMIWMQGDNDIVEMNGEAGSKMTTDYLDDSGYYIWYVPLAFRTGNLYSKISVKASCSSKYTISQSYDASLFDISRCTMYRNIIHTWAYYGLKGPWWSVIFCSPGINYDGSIEEYEGIVYPDSTYRLWGWGWRPGGKATSISHLVEKYNYDLALFLAS